VLIPTPATAQLVFFYNVIITGTKPKLQSRHREVVGQGE
jgi:hypothetical protein